MTETTAPREQKRLELPLVNHPALVALRAEAGWSQAETARKAGISQGHLSEIERGLTAPRPGTLIKLTSAFGVDPTDLLITDLTMLANSLAEQLATQPELCDESRSACQRLLPLVAATTGRATSPR